MPFLILLMAGSMELGNYFLTEHAVTKQVRMVPATHRG